MKTELKGGRTASGFTLLELLIVISLMVLLSGLLIPAFYKVQNESRKRQAATEAAVIAGAIQAYRLQERKFPAPSNPNHIQGGQDRTYGDAAVGSLLPDGGNERVLTLLRGANPPVLDENKLRLEDNHAINPWGRQYRIKLDLNYDGMIDGNALQYKVEWDFR